VTSLALRLPSAAALAVLLSAPALVPASAQRLAPCVVRSLAGTFRLTEAECGTLGGRFETAVALPSSAPDGVAERGAIAIEARPESYLRWAEAFADFDLGSSVQAVRRLSSPPRLSDFDTLVLSADELRELQRCRVRTCAVQLDEPSIARIAAINWRAPDAAARANTVVREMLFGIAQRYIASGHAALPQYHDSKHPTNVHADFNALIDEEAAAGTAPPALLDFLRGRPGAALPGATSYLYWTTNTFGLKPTTRLNHTVVYRNGGTDVAGIIATKMLYASHYFHGGLEMRYVVTDETSADRFVLLMVTRSRSDGLTGVTGAVIGNTIRRKGLESLRRYLRFTKEAVETRERRGWTSSPPKGKDRP